MRQLDWAAQQEKREARSTMVKLPEYGTAGTALFLPGQSLVCMKEALQQRTINLRSFCLLAEADWNICQLIRRRLPKFGFVRRPFLHPSLIETLDLDVVLRGDTLDYAFLDFCSPLNESRVYWLGGLAELFSPQATFAITFQRNRGGGFVGDYRELLRRRKSRAFWASVADQLPGCSPATVDTVAVIILVFSRFRRLEIENVVEYRNNSSGSGGSWMTSVRFQLGRPVCRPPGKWQWAYKKLTELLVGRSNDWRLTQVCV